MFYRDSRGDVVGVLCDWDLAASAEDIGTYNPLSIDKSFYETVKSLAFCTEVQSDLTTSNEDDIEDEAPQKRKPRHRTGTVPFMAMDLLQHDEPPVHLYRHDLESFFWVLVYFVATHDPARHTIGHIDQWTDRDLWAVGHAKADFLTHPPNQDLIARRMDSRYQPIWSEALWPLGRKFAHLYLDHFTEQDRRIDYVVAKVKGKEKDIERIGSELKAIAEKRSKRVELNDFLNALY